MKFTWNPLYKMFLGEDGKMYTPKEREQWNLEQKMVLQSKKEIESTTTTI
jgi:hypothetical protein